VDRALRIVDAELLGFVEIGGVSGTRAFNADGRSTPNSLRFSWMAITGRSTNVEPTKMLFSGDGPAVTPHLPIAGASPHRGRKFLLWCGRR